MCPETDFNLIWKQKTDKKYPNDHGNLLMNTGSDHLFGNMYILAASVGISGLIGGKYPYVF